MYAPKKAYKRSQLVQLLQHNTKQNLQLTGSLSTKLRQFLKAVVAASNAHRLTTISSSANENHYTANCRVSLQIQYRSHIWNKHHLKHQNVQQVL